MANNNLMFAKEARELTETSNSLMNLVARLIKDAATHNICSVVLAEDPECPFDTKVMDEVKCELKAYGYSVEWDGDLNGYVIRW